MSKEIAIIDRPDDCQQCVFGVCKYSLPLSVSKKGYYCQLLPPEQRVAQEFDYEAEVHLNNCPLVPMPKRDMAGIGGEYDAGAKAGWNACIDVIGGKN